MTTISWEKRRLGRTEFRVTPLGLGGAWLGRIPDGSIDEDLAVQTVLRALALGINLIDTSGTYEGGKSEIFIGRALEAWYRRGGKREDLILSTKTGTRVRPHDYSGKGTRWSIEKSLEALKTDYLDIALVHDPEDLEPVLAPGGAWDTLKALKAEGVVRAIGLGIHNLEFHERMIETGDLDVSLTHSKYHLLNQEAGESMLNTAMTRDVGVFNATALAGGFLSGEAPEYVIERLEAQRQRFLRHLEQAKDLPPEQLCERRARFEVWNERATANAEKATALWEWSQANGIDLLALNLHFCARDPRITAILMGASKPEHIAADVAALQSDVPDWVWAELPGLGVTLPPENAR